MSHGMKVVGKVLVLVAVVSLMAGCALKEQSSRKTQKPRKSRRSEIEVPAQVQPADLELLVG